MTLRRTTTCRGCGKTIAFIKTKNGKSIPVDPEPVQFVRADEYQKFVTELGTIERGRPMDGDELDAERFLIGYRSHFATCPAAEDFRRKKNKSERTKGGADRERDTENTGDHHDQPGDWAGGSG